jgi:DHA2 family multidrug resistance protein-like MFS transporter
MAPRRPIGLVALSAGLALMAALPADASPLAIAWRLTLCGEQPGGRLHPARAAAAFARCAGDDHLVVGRLKQPEAQAAIDRPAARPVPRRRGRRGDLRAPACRRHRDGAVPDSRCVRRGASAHIVASSVRRDGIAIGRCATTLVLWLSSALALTGALASGLRIRR